MEKVNYKTKVLLIILVIIIAVYVGIPYSFGLQCEDTPALWQLFLDWLRGQSKGIVKFTIIPITNRKSINKLRCICT